MSSTTELTTTHLRTTQAATTDVIDGITVDVNTHWMIYAGTLVFLMQAGFSLLEAGSISAKNATNIIFKNLLVSFAQQHTRPVHTRLLINLQNLTRRMHASAPPASLGGGTHLHTEIRTLMMICQSFRLRTTRQTPSLAHQTSSLLPRMGQVFEPFSSSGHLLPQLQPLSAALLRNASRSRHTLFTQFLSRHLFTRWSCTGYGLPMVSCVTGMQMWQPSHLFPTQRISSILLARVSCILLVASAHSLVLF